MRAVLYSEPLTYSIRDLADRALQPGEVRLAVLRVGVCGTDLHLHRGHFGARYPHTPGHEIVGEVVEIAQGVGGFVVGDRVVVEEAASVGGTILVYGVAEADKRISVSPFDIFKRELTIMGSYAQALNIGRAVTYLGTLPPTIGRLITHRFRLADYGLAIDALGSSECIKAIVVPGDR